MKKRITLLLFIILPGYFAIPQMADFVVKTDSLLNYLYSENLFSGRILFEKNGNVIYCGEFDRFTKGTKKTKIGSVTKVFTALIIYQLIDEEKLELSQPIGKYFPEIKYSSDITIEQLLSHTSGIYNITDWNDYYATRRKTFTREEIIDLVTSHKPEFKPGKDCSYSNTNYILLGFIIEEVTGKSYALNIKERIADKSGLNDTYFPAAGADQSWNGNSYQFNGEVWTQDVDSDPSLPFSAGALISSNEDLATMMYDLFNHRIISDTSLKTMKTMINGKIGHGLLKAPFYEHKGWGHTGRIDEYRAFAGYFPDDSLILTITSNGMTVNLNDVLTGVLSTYFGRDYTFPPKYDYNMEIPATDVFTGNYKAKLAGFITVARFQITNAGRNHLFMNENFDNPYGEKVLLERKGAYVFHSREARGDLLFSTNKKGEVKGIIFQQGKMKIHCKKVS